ncbi:MAG: universal stress protein [Bradymonadaceae bacterium]
MSTIMLATDLSEEARGAADWAFEWASGQDTDPVKIVVVHVITTDELALRRVVYNVSDDEHLEAIQEEVIEWLAPHRREDVDIEIAVYAGSPIRELRRASEEHGPSWLVLAMSGKGFLGKLFLGSTASRIAHDPPCPTFIHHPDGIDSKTPHVIAAMDFSETSAKAALGAARVAKLMGGRLSLVHVIELPKMVPSLAESTIHPQSISKHIEDSTTWAREQLAEFVAGHPGDFVNLATTLEVLPGYPAHELIAFARAEGGDILVLGNAGRSALGNFLMGSVATRVVQDMPCTILIFPAVKPVDS